MPVTTTLLLKLRETLGEEAANDLVTWVDQATQLQQRLAEVRADLRLELGQGLATVREELAAVRQELTQGLATGRQELVQGLAALRVELASQRSDLIKWMFIFWAGTIIPLAGLMVALIRL